MAGLVPAEVLRVCLGSLGKAVVVDRKSGKSFEQGGYVTHSLMRLPDDSPFVIELRQHWLHIDAASLLAHSPRQTLMEALACPSMPIGAQPATYDALIFVVDAASLTSSSGHPDASTASQLLHDTLTNVDKGSPSRPTLVAVLVLNCAEQKKDKIQGSACEYLRLSSLQDSSVLCQPATDDGRNELFEVIDWFSTQLQHRVASRWW